MFCPECGSSLEENSKFCKECGYKISASDFRPKRVQLRCSNCNGEMLIDKGHEILTCPYCGSREVVLESDRVKIEKIRSSTYKELAIGKLKRQEEKKREKKARAMAEEFRKSKFSMCYIILSLVFLLVTVNDWIRGFTFGAILSFGQTVLIFLAWLFGNQFLPERKKFHQVLALLALLLVIPYSRLYAAKDTMPQLVKQQYEWPGSDLAAMLDKPESEYGRIYHDTEREFSLDVADVSKDQYRAYVKSCKEKGFDYEIAADDYGFDGFNKDRYRVRVSYYDSIGEMNIYLQAPIIMEEFHWPKTELVKQIPKLDKPMGNIQYESKDNFCIYLDNVTREEFGSYIDSCIEAGFDQNYSRNKTYFNGSNKENINLSVCYEGMGMISIRANRYDI